MKFKYIVEKMIIPDWATASIELVSEHKDPKEAWKKKRKLNKTEEHEDVCYQVVIEPLEGGE